MSAADPGGGAGPGTGPGTGPAYAGPAYSGPTYPGSAYPGSAYSGPAQPTGAGRARGGRGGAGGAGPGCRRGGDDLVAGGQAAGDLNGGVTAHADRDRLGHFFPIPLHDPNGGGVATGG